jgi:hypothetical protein
MRLNQRRNFKAFIVHGNEGTILAVTEVKQKQCFWLLVMSGDPLTTDYFDNFDNEFLNKYKKS